MWLPRRSLALKLTKKAVLPKPLEKRVRIAGGPIELQRRLPILSRAKTIESSRIPDRVSMHMSKNTLSKR
jgi:hypothetical protein